MFFACRLDFGDVLGRVVGVMGRVGWMFISKVFG